MSDREPMLHLPGEGEDVSEGRGRTVHIKVGREELAVTESSYAPGESGPGPHVHREHTDSFWVLDGRLHFQVAGEDISVSEGSFLLVPRMVVHTFRNPGSTDARFLNFHAPSRGFHEYLRARPDSGDGGDEKHLRERFDMFDPPAGGGRDASDALLRGKEEGESVSLGDSRVAFKAGREDSGGALSLTETSIPPRFPGPVPHWHESFLDSFYVLEGTLGLRLGDRTVAVPAGSYAFAPPGAVHTFFNPAEGRVRILNVMAPGGFEQYLKQVAAEASGGDPPDLALMAEIAARYDFHPVG